MRRTDSLCGSTHHILHLYTSHLSDIALRRSTKIRGPSYQVLNIIVPKIVGRDEGAGS